MNDDDVPEGLYEMSPHEAGEAMKSDPGSVVFPILVFMTQFNLEKKEIWPELLAGRIKASGVPTEFGFKGVVITGKSLVSWLQNPETPPHLIEKVRAAMSGRRRADA